MSVYINGIGTVSALGPGISSLKGGLEGGTRPVLSAQKIETSQGEFSLPVYMAGVSGLDRFVPKASLRRIDRFIQMALLSSSLAVEDSGIELRDRTRVGIVFGTGYGPLNTTFNFLDSLIDFGDKCASPTLFANSVHNSLAAQVSISLKLQGPSLTLTSFEQTTVAVMAEADNWLQGGDVDYVLAGVGDEYCDVRGYATLLSEVDNPSGISPFMFDDCSYLPGEGFVSFLLGKGPSEKGYGRIVNIENGKADADISNAHEVLFLAANGEKAAGRYYKALTAGGSKCRAYSSLYGGMPVGNGFDVAIAALSLKEGVLFPTPGEDAGTEELHGSERIGCVGFDRNGALSLLTLTK